MVAELTGSAAAEDPTTVPARAAMKAVECTEKRALVDLASAATEVAEASA